jgi:hypothetical protein
VECSADLAVARELPDGCRGGLFLAPLLLVPRPAGECQWEILVWGASDGARRDEAADARPEQRPVSDAERSAGPAPAVLALDVRGLAVPELAGQWHPIEFRAELLLAAALCRPVVVPSAAQSCAAAPDHAVAALARPSW